LALGAQFLHHGLDEGFCAFHAADDRLKVEGGDIGVAARGAVHAVLANHDQGVSEEVEGDGEPAALRAHHELVFLQLGALVIEDAHEGRVSDSGPRR